MLRFGRAAMPRSATLQTSDQIVIQIAHMQVPSHSAPLRSLISMISYVAVWVKRGVVAHAIDEAAVTFYERHGFLRTPLGERIMLLPIETVRSLIGQL